MLAVEPEKEVKRHAFRVFFYHYAVAMVVLLPSIAAARRLFLPSHRRDEWLEPLTIAPAPNSCEFL